MTDPIFPTGIETERTCMMNWREHINRNSEVLSGKPKIKGTRISVELIVGRLGDGWSIEQLIEAYPHINETQIRAALAYSAQSLASVEGCDVHQIASYDAFIDSLKFWK